MRFQRLENFTTLHFDNEINHTEKDLSTEHQKDNVKFLTNKTYYNPSVTP